jgi:hypothetical protein
MYNKFYCLSRNEGDKKRLRHRSLFFFVVDDEMIFDGCER